MYRGARLPPQPALRSIRDARIPRFIRSVEAPTVAGRSLVRRARVPKSEAPVNHQPSGRRGIRPSKRRRCRSRLPLDTERGRGAASTTPVVEAATIGNEGMVGFDLLASRRAAVYRVVGQIEGESLRISADDFRALLAGSDPLRVMLEKCG